MECDHAEETPLLPVFPPVLQPIPLFCLPSAMRKEKHESVSDHHALPAASSFSLMPQIHNQGEAGKNVPAKMTRCKPDQRRWSFCESVTAGVRENETEEKKEGGEKRVLD